MRLLLVIIAIAATSCSMKPTRFDDYDVDLNHILDEPYSFIDQQVAGIYQIGGLCDKYKCLERANYAVGSTWQGVTNPSSGEVFTIPYAKGGYHYSLFQGSNNSLLLVVYVKDALVHYPDEAPTIIPKETTKDEIAIGITRDLWSTVPFHSVNRFP